VLTSGITVFGKPNCGLCKAAKEKLDLLKVPYTEGNVDEILQLHTGWRKDGSVEIVAFYYALGTLPVIQKDGELMSYPQLMKVLKNK